VNQATDRSTHPHELEPRLLELIDWAREFLEIEAPGQYTSDAALHLALVVWAKEQAVPIHVRQTLPLDATVIGDVLP